MQLPYGCILSLLITPFILSCSEQTQSKSGSRDTLSIVDVDTLNQDKERSDVVDGQDPMNAPPQTGSTTAPTESCLIGSENCVCYPNGSCDPKDGLPMACIDGHCVDRPMIEPGILGGLCDAQTPCEAFQGQTLSCVNGLCAIDSCPSGRMGCPCGSNGACQPRDGVRGMCRDQFCVPFGCESGDKDCVCDQGTCAEGLSCDLNVCRQVSQFTITLSVGERVRACDLLFEVDEGKVELRLSDLVMAKMSRRGRKIGVSMISRTDVAPPREPITFVLDRPSSISPGTERLILVKSTCYDRLGHHDERAEVHIR